MIMWKSLYSGWKEVTKEQVIKLVKITLDGAVNITENEKENYINNNRLKGVKVCDLIK